MCLQGIVYLFRYFFNKLRLVHSSSMDEVCLPLLEISQSYYQYLILIFQVQSKLVTFILYQSYFSIEWTLFIFSICLLFWCWLTTIGLYIEMFLFLCLFFFSNRNRILSFEGHLRASVRRRGRDIERLWIFRIMITLFLDKFINFYHLCRHLRVSQLVHNYSLLKNCDLFFKQRLLLFQFFHFTLEDLHLFRRNLLWDR